MRKTKAEWLLCFVQCAGRNNSRLVLVLALLRFVFLQDRQHNPCACPKTLNIRFLGDTLVSPALAIAYSANSG
mgnify:CR=1 FL=1